MSDDLARARAWLAAGEAKHPLPPTVTLTPDSFRTFLMEAFVEGLFAARDDFAIEAATGQRQLDDANALMREAVHEFRTYERHHLDKIGTLIATVPDDPGQATLKIEETTRKANVNALMAMRLEAWLAGKDQYPTSFERDLHGWTSRIELPRRGPGSMSPDEVKAQEEFVSAALDAGIAQIGEGDEPYLGIAVGGFVDHGPRADIPVIMAHGCDVNPAEIARQIGESMVDGETIKGVDHESFDRGVAYLDQPVEFSPLVAAMTASIDEISSLPVAPAQSLAEIRRTQAVLCGFTYWPGGDTPPLDLETDGEVLIDWGDQPSGPRFTICGVEELTPMPGLWAETVDPESFGTIIGYRADPDRAAPADAKAPSSLVAGERSPLAALVQARNWLLSAESLIAEAAEHIRGVTGVNPGSDSADLVARLDAWLTPMATRPADEGAEKEARRSSVTHQGEDHGDA